MPRAKGLGRHRKKKALASKLDQLRVMTTVVADTGDLGAVACLEPVDCTTRWKPLSCHRFALFYTSRVARVIAPPSSDGLS